MKELQIGQTITGRRVEYRKPRIAALVVSSLAMAFGLARAGTTITHTGSEPKPAAVCPNMSCGETVRGGTHTGGGTIRTSPTP